MLLRLTAPTSAGKRSMRWLSFFNPFTIKNPKLSTGFTKKVGKGLTGKKTVLSKGHSYATHLYKRSETIFTKATIIGNAVRFEHRLNVTSAVVLVKNAIGCWYYIQPSSNVKLLTYVGCFNPLIPTNFSFMNGKA